MPTTSRNQRRRQPTRLSQSPNQPRRQPARVIEPPDYSRDYAYVRRDLIRITLIGGLLFAAMIAASFFM